MRLTAVSYNVAMVSLLAAIAADIGLGHEFVLNGIATIAVTFLMITVFGLGALLLLLFVWITVRDAIDEIQTERQSGLAWRWQIVGYLGFVGILAEGAVGMWYASQNQVLFSDAIENIPYAGVPVLVALASYPAKWLERAWLHM